MNKRAILVTGLLTLFNAVPGVSLAAKCAGTNINNLLSWDQTEISKGTTLATMRFTSVVMSDDPSSSFHMVSGECVGISFTTPDGKTREHGYCARRNKEGDVLNEEWFSTDDGATKGTLKLLGGTGKFAKASGTAQWEFTQLQGKMGSARWIGSCQ
jgi:hypothetical protein